MTTLSVVVAMGFVDQKNVEHPELGDEFDHMAPLANAKEDVELIIVDRVWPTRWGRVQEALARMLDRVAYVPPKPSPVISHGYRAVSSMRNSGAICSSGNLLAFVDDYCWLDGAVADEVCRYFEEKGRVLCPLFHESVEPGIQGDGVVIFSGHSPAIYMCSRDDFIAVNGFDENFDGAYGEEDTEFQNRIDRLLWLRGQNNALRVRRKGLFWRRTWHENGHFTEDRRPPWDVSTKDSGYLRCNRSYFQAVCNHRIEANDTFGNRVPNESELKALERHKCAETCSLCNGGDRGRQIESYTGVLRTDELVGEKVKLSSSTCFKNGSYNPWKGSGR